MPRVAYFPDSFVEVNGVAMTSNRLVNYAKAHECPFLCVHAGPSTETHDEGSVRFVSLKRSPLALSMDEGLAYDPLFQRHTNMVLRELMKFQPDVVHITGLNDVSIMGAYLAWKLKLPLMGSWHTNLHEFAGRRIRKMLKFLSPKSLDAFVHFIEKKILDGALLYYKMPRIILAPNQELVDMLEKGTRRESRLMIRGVDTELFDPAKRTVDDGKIRLGFVGRLQAEKNPRILADVGRALTEAGKGDFEFLIVGEGSEREWMEKNVPHAVFTGFLKGEDLARAYANMDIFLFPSETDAFGNVAQEAMAAGAPVIVSNMGGPKYIIRDGETGFVAKTPEQYGEHVLKLMNDPGLLARMKRNSREFAMTRSWDSVFEGVYRSYSDTIAAHREGAPNSPRN